MKAQIDMTIANAVKAFQEGKLVAMPTETVYGLAAPFDNPALVKKIFELKLRPFFDPLIVHVENAKQAKPLVGEWSETAQRLADHFWPGPLTLVLPKSKMVSHVITSGLDSVGIRCPKHPMALSFLKELGTPVVAPSANLFKKTSPTAAQHVRASFSERDVFILEGGPCEVGIESTILKILAPGRVALLRKGFITKGDLKQHFPEIEIVEPAELGRTQGSGAQKVEAPGQMEDHYMPELPLLYCRSPEIPVGKLLAEASKALRKDLKRATLLQLDDQPALAARQLYAKLREASAVPGADAIVCFEEVGWGQNELWDALKDKLHKASSLLL